MEKPGLLFDGFIAYLRRQGFIIGVDHHVRLQELLNRLGPGCEPAHLKYLLCPIFAAGEKQQQQFYRAFDSYFKPLEVSAEPTGESPSGKPGKKEPVASPGEEVNPPKWQYILLGILLVILVVVLFYRWGEGPEKKIESQAMAAPDQPGIVNPAEGKKNPVTDQGKGIPGNQSQGAAEKPGRLKKIELFLLAYSYIARWVGLLIPFIILLLIELYKYNRRRLILVKQRGKKPPFVWPIKVETPGTGFIKNDRFYRATHFLRKRTESAVTCLDIEKTIAGTIAGSGYPEFRYKSLTRPPEYLVLIDLPGYRDHYAHLCDSLVTALADEGVYVIRYFYEQDPRVCFQEIDGQREYLFDLKTRYSDHRLIICGDGDGLLDPLTGEMARWTGLFGAWPERALLATRPPGEWGGREHTLAGEFILVPAALEGLCALKDHWEMPGAPGLNTWKDKDAASPLFMVGKEEEYAEKLRDYLGSDTFQWVCACAVYPELHWDLTLYLGTLPCMPENLAGEGNILRLLRLPWFRTGVMPDELRWALISRLDTGKSRAVRSAIVELLEKNPAPKESFADESYRLHLVVQRWMLSREDRQKRKAALKSLKSIGEKSIVQDYTLLRFLEAAPETPLHLVLPKRLQKLFYNKGIPLFGIKRCIRVGIAMLLAITLFLFLSPGAGDLPLEELLLVRKAGGSVNKNGQGSWEADYGDGTIMVYIPAGEFTMGSTDNDNERPPHKVYLDGYWIGKYEVTFSQYDKYCELTGKEKPDDWGWGRGNRPVINVSWDDAVVYCQWLSQKTGQKFTLPTEAQWEKAARGSRGFQYPWGDEFDKNKCNSYESGLGKTMPVGSYPSGKSPYGCMDMAGNVWEWCADWYDENYYKKSPAKNPQGPAGGSVRVLRGGSWVDYDWRCRAAFRNGGRPADRIGLIGFRLLRSL